MRVSRIRNVLLGAKYWIIRHNHNLTRISIIALLLYLGGLSIWLDISFLDRTQWIILDTPGGNFWAQVLISMGPELAGIVIGVVMIDYLNERRQDAQLLKQLILQMASSHNDVTDSAVRSLRAYGWLTDGSLKKARLWGANLQGIDLKKANLQGAYLSLANLEGAYLSLANLQGASLEIAKLQGAHLVGAKLQKAGLGEAKLQGARLIDAKLQGANLSLANLQGADLGLANLQGANLDYAELQGADLGYAELQGIKNYTNSQLLGAKTLKGATMPDGTIFEEWILKIQKDYIDPRARIEIDRLMQEYGGGEEE